jgi:hypothetical protein
MTFTKYLMIGVVAAVVLLVPLDVMGKSTEAKDNAAKKACLTGDVEKGTAILADLYIQTGDPTFIYNQGRCFEQNGRNDQAILRFKEYLRKATRLSRAETDAVRKKIDELREADYGEVKPTLAPTPSPAPAAPAPTAPPAPAPVATIPPPVATTPDPLGISRSAPPPEPQPGDPVYKRWWFWTGIGAVVAGGVVTGILLGSKSARTSPACVSGSGVTCVP